MDSSCSRRRFLAVVPAVALGGCVAGGDESSTPEPTETEGAADPAGGTPTETEAPMTTDDGSGSSSDRQEQVERLPEPSPLTQSLTELVAAEDRSTAAAEYSLDYRESDGMVKVEIELESDGDLPGGYRVEDVSQYDGTVQAYVHVDDLVPLAMEDDVRIVREPPEARTDGPATG